MKTLLLLILTALSLTTQLHAQSAFRTRASGNWNNILTWEKWDGGTWVNPSSPTDYPGATDSVYIQLLHTVSLTQSHSCNHLNLNNGLGVRLQLNDFNLLVYGRIGLFSGTAAFPLTYTNLNLGASVNNGTNNLGNIRITGNNRTVFRATEWATNFTSLNLEIVLIDNTQIVGAEADLTLGRLRLLSGDLSIGGNLFMDDGSTGGDVFIGAATLLSVAKSIMRNNLSAPADSIVIAGILQLGSNTSGNSLIAGTLNLSAGGVLDMHNSSPIAFTVTNYVIHTASRLMYSGNVPDQPVGNEFPRNGIKNLVINTTGSVALNTGKNISDTLIMIAGNVRVPPGDSLSLGINANAVLQHTSGSVIGKMNRYIPALTTSVVLFPVGSDQYYRPISVDFSGASINSGNISIAHVNDTGGLDITGFTDGGFLINRRSNMYWNIDINAGLLANNISLNAGINGQSGITDSSQLRLIGSRDNGLNLSLLGAVSVPLLSNILGLLGIDLDSNNIRLYLGGNVNTNPLPVKLSAFAAQYVKNEVELKWQTAAEYNNDYFEVQRSADGKSFFTVTAIKGNGNAAQASHYIYVDPAPFSGINYYRLAQYDYNKRVFYSHLIMINTGEAQEMPALAIGPNPVTDVLSIKLGHNPYSGIRVINMLGQAQIDRELNTATTDLSINMGVLDRGTYLVQFLDGDKVIKSHRIIRQ
ncbi:MAG: T9SS type A sorting domain-containing protein [Bacteroidota bacterium]